MSDPYNPTNPPYGGSTPNPQPPYGQPPAAAPYGQPPAAPIYGVPTYGAPTYGAPTYGAPSPPPAPTYGAPTYGGPPGPAYGGPPTFGAPYGAAPPPAKSRTAMWVVIAAVVLVLVGGGATVAVLLSQHQSVTEHLSSPKTIGNLTLSPDPSGNLTSQASTSDIRNEVDNPTGTIANLYLENDNLTKPVVVVAVTGKVGDPDTKITQVFQEEGAQQFTNVHSVDAGNLSGTAKCGSATQDGQILAVCVWVDPGSLGAVVCLNRDPAEVENIFRQVRNAVLTRDS